MSSVHRTVSLARYPVDGLAYARYRRLPGRDAVVVTNDAGRHELLPGADFERLLRGELTVDGELHARLADQGFLRRAPRTDVLADRLRERREYLFQGPSLHIIIVTLRCDQIC